MTLITALKLELPIIQAPMAGVQNSALAAAVSAAGGLGSLPGAMLTPEALAAELGLLNATGKPYNVNFFCHRTAAPDLQREQRWRKQLAPYFAELDIDPQTIAPAPARKAFDEHSAQLLAKFRPPVVSFHFGLPQPALLRRVKACGAQVLASATTVEEALWLQQHGADAVIAQGLEAGGHRGNFLSNQLSRQSGTFALLPQVLAALDIPVIAAGGIADANGVKAAIDLGATAVQLGTSYLLCPEATTSPLHRAALVSPDAAHTALTNVFSGRYARGIVNRAIREQGPDSPYAPAFPTAATAMGALRAAAEARDSSDFTPLWCGQNVSGAAPIAAGALTRQLASALSR